MDSYHVSTSIDGLLRRDDQFLSNLFCGDGRAIRIELNKRKSNGDILIGSEGCEGFCPVNGCPGHEEKEVQNG